MLILPELFHCRCRCWVIDAPLRVLISSATTGPPHRVTDHRADLPGPNIDPRGGWRHDLITSVFVGLDDGIHPVQRRASGCSGTTANTFGRAESNFRPWRPRRRRCRRLSPAIWRRGRSRSRPPTSPPPSWRRRPRWSARVARRHVDHHRTHDHHRRHCRRGWPRLRPPVPRHRLPAPGRPRTSPRPTTLMKVDDSNEGRRHHEG